MATASGTATSYLDLLSRFNTFVTTTLPTVQRWTQLKDSVEGTNDRNLYYSAPGLTGTDLIYVNLFAFKDIGNDIYNLGARGMTGFNTGAPYNNQPNQSPAAYLHLWNSSIPYWFIGSGRRAIIIAKVSGVYQCMYLGFITPHAAPSEWAYPLFVGGCSNDPTKRWSNTSPAFRNFWNPSSDDANDPTVLCSGAYLRTASGSWLAFGNYAAGTSGAHGSGNLVWPYCTQFEQQGKLYGGGANYALTPLVLHSSVQGGNVFGEFDGIFFVSGFGNAAENTFSISSVNYLVVQDAFRSEGPDPASSAHNSYAAFALA